MIPAEGALRCDHLTKAFGAVRSREVGGFEWVGPRDRTGKASDMAEQIGADAGARADVVPTMQLLFRRAKAGKMSRGDEVLRDAAFAFGAWCSQFTALREEHRGMTPAVPVKHTNGRPTDPVYRSIPALPPGVQRPPR